MEEFTNIALDTLPNETLFEIFRKMELKDILSLCKLKNFASFCDDDYLWERLLERDYPDFPVVGNPKTHYMKIHDDKGDLYRWGAHSILVPGNRYPAGTVVRRLNFDLFHQESEGSISDEQSFYFGSNVSDDIEEGISSGIKELLRKLHPMEAFPSVVSGSIRKEKLDWDEEEEDVIEFDEQIETFHDFSVFLNDILDEYGLHDNMVYELFLEEKELAMKIQLNHITV